MGAAHSRKGYEHIDSSRAHRPVRSLVELEEAGPYHSVGGGGEDPNPFHSQLHGLGPTAGWPADDDDAGALFLCDAERAGGGALGPGEGHRTDDAALRCLYHYWQSRGMHCLVAERLTTMLRLLFTFIITGFVAFCLNWSDIVGCQQEKCETVAVLRSHPFRDMGLARVFALVFELALLAWLLWSAWSLRTNVAAWRRARRFLSHIGVAEDGVRFRAVDWRGVCQRLIDWQHADPQNRVRCDGSHGDGVLTELGIAQCIMRRENFLVALVACGVLDLSSLNRFMEWLLLEGVIARLFSEDSRIRRDVSAAEIKSWLRWYGLIAVIGTPFAALWCVLGSVFRYGIVMRHDPTRLSTSHWSGIANWRFREYNELPHVFQVRMGGAKQAAQLFMDAYPDPLSGIVARVVIFVFGGLAVVIFGLSLLNDSALVFISFSGKSMLWWLSVFTLVAMSANSQISSTRTERLDFDPKEEFKALARKWTHWMPERWRAADRGGGGGDGRLSFHAVVTEFQSHYFQRALTYYFWEGLSILQTAYVLLFVLPAKADDIMVFLRDFHCHVPGVGDVLVWSTFDFREHGAVLPEQRDQISDGKLEKSLLSFYAAHYPCWPRDQEAGEELMQVIRRLAPSLEAQRRDQLHGLRSLREPGPRGGRSGTPPRTPPSGARSPADSALQRDASPTHGTRSADPAPAAAAGQASDASLPAAAAGQRPPDGRLSGLCDGGRAVVSRIVAGELDTSLMESHTSCDALGRYYGEPSMPRGGGQWR
eukprot:TRINITY_DN10005_c0_g1_i1.p1 TRINITY_DN10005_c0_g1~~TRINITY_DN10005_c0_g1_i1.p1  ORF type:complete len:763 (+),score=231.69 TRINITY_DN10005_c0_g1_i1:93-2381(+)